MDSIEDILETSPLFKTLTRDEQEGLVDRILQLMAKPPENSHGATLE